MPDTIMRKVEITRLSGFYGGILTEKQQEILAMYCGEDMSLSEIAAAMNVSKQCIHEQFKKTCGKLLDMEKKLGCAAKFGKMQQGLAECKRAIVQRKYDDALCLLDKLIDLNQEDDDGI